MMDDTFFDSENYLNNQLINKILVVAAITIGIALIAAELRVLKIGWSYRDVIQIVIVSIIAILAGFRNKLPFQSKVISLTILLSIGGFSGVYTLGMLGGTILIFPTTCVIVAVFYTKLLIRIYIGISIIFLIFVAARFCSVKSIIPFDVNFLLSSPQHWVVYISCMATFFMVASVAIQNYRKKMEILIGKIRSQSDELAKSNESLLTALGNIKTLSGLLPICASCKKIRDDKGYWNQLESYIKEHSDAVFSHGICPDCAKQLYPNRYHLLQRVEKKNKSE